MNFAVMLKKIEAFCRRGVHRMHRNSRTSLEHLTEALVFHAMRGTLAVVWEQDEIAGVAVAWQTTRAKIDQAERDNRSVFDWQPNQPDGDAVYLALVLTTQRNAMRRLAKYFLEKFPQWAQLPMLAHRRGRLRDETGLLNRLAGLRPAERI